VLAGRERGARKWEPTGGSVSSVFTWISPSTFSGLGAALPAVLAGETTKGGTWFALGLLTMARIAQSFWGR
jgi:hypothetical protein